MRMYLLYPKNERLCATLSAPVLLKFDKSCSLTENGHICLKVVQFNCNHTVADIRRFIAASRPELTSEYSLMTAFPSVALKDNTASLEGAGLLNAVVIQKLT